MRIFKFLMTASFGYFCGLLFAQKSGKKFREEIRAAKNPLKVIFDECCKVDSEAYKVISEWAKNSDELQKILKMTKEQFAEFLEKIKKCAADKKKCGLGKIAEKFKFKKNKKNDEK